jgi:hypothetical protein
MWWTFLLLLSGSYVDMVNNPAELRICAAAAEVSAQQAEKNGADEFDIRINRAIAKIFVDRLVELGADDSAALATVKKGLGDSPAEMAIYERCQTIVASMPAEGSLLDGALAADSPAAGVDESAGGAWDAAAADDAAIEDVPPAPEIDGAPILASLSEPRRREIRCATIASAIMYDVGRGVSDKSYGLTGEGADTLAGRLAEVIMTETGMGEAEVRAAYKADFEAFTFGLLGEGQDEKTALAAVEAGIAQCRTLYDSIDLSEDGDGRVAGLTRVSMLGGVAAPSTAVCYAMLSAFTDGAPAGDKEVAPLRAKKEAIGALYYKEAGRTPDSTAALAAAVRDFDSAAFEALPEEKAETRMSFCFGLADS